MRILLILAVFWAVGSLVYTHVDGFDDARYRVEAWWAEITGDHPANDPDETIALAAVIATLAQVVTESAAKRASPPLARSEAIRPGAAVRPQDSPWHAYDVQTFEAINRKPKGGAAAPVPIAPTLGPARAARNPAPGDRNGRGNPPRP